MCAGFGIPSFEMRWIDGANATVARAIKLQAMSTEDLPRTLSFDRAPAAAFVDMYGSTLRYRTYSDTVVSRVVM